MITGIIEVTQDPEQAGSTLKILSLRLRGMKGSLEEMGEEVDENVENISKMQGQVLNLTKGKVNIFDGAGEFRSTYEIMRDIANVWDELNSTAQADLLETIAGKHRANSVMALLSNWQNVEAAVKSANEAEGSAARENSKYIDSVQGRLDKLTTAWQSFANTFMNSDFLKGGISALTTFVELIEKLIDSLGTLGTLGLGVGIFGLFKSRKTGLKTDIFSALSNFGSVASDVMSSSDGLIKKFKGVGKAAGSAGGSVIKSFGGSLSAITAGIGLAVTVIGLIVNAYKNYKEEISEARQETIQASNDFLDASYSFEQAYIKYSGKTNLTAEEEAELETAINGTVDALDDKSSALQGVINSSNDYLSSLERIAQAELEAADAAAKNKRNNAELELKDLVKGWSDIDGSEVNISVNKSDIGSEFLADSDWFKSVTIPLGRGQVSRLYNLEISANASASEILNYYYELVEIQNRMNVAAEDNKDILNSSTYTKISTTIEKMSDAIAVYESGVYDAVKAQYQLANGIPKTTEAYLKMRESILRSDDVKNLSIGAKQMLVGSLDSEYGQIFDLSSAEAQARKFVGIIKGFGDTEVGKVETFLNMRTAVNNNEVPVGEYLSELENVSTIADEWNDKEKEEFNLAFGIDTDSVKQQYDELKTKLTDDYYEIGMSDNNAKAFLDNLKSKELSAVGELFSSDNVDFKNILKDYNDILDEAKQSSVDFSKTVYGNIDTNARQTLEWTSENLSKYKDELMSWEPENASWDKVRKEYEDAISTVMGTVSSYEIDGKEVDIAFSPMLQTDKGAEVLSSGTVDTYINELISKATEDGKWDKNELIALDAKGLEVDGQKIKGILADIGETAQATGEQMHFVGKDGALALAESELFAIVEKQAQLLEAMNYTIAIDVETESLDALNTALAESVSATGLSSESIAALKGRYAELESEGYNLSAMFEETSNGIHLNKEAVSELEQALASNKLTETDKQLEVLKGRYDELTTEIDKCRDAGDRAALYTEQQSIVDKINDLATLASQYKGLTSAYNAWQSAESAGSERDMYEGIIEGFETVGDEIKRGWVDDGTIKFLELLTGKTDLASKSGKQLKEIYDSLDDTIKYKDKNGKVVENTGYSINDFFTVDEDGNSTNTGVYNFLDAIGKLEEEAFGGLDVVKRDGEGNIIGFDFELVAKKDKNGNVIKNGDQVIAEALGISEELVQIMVRASDDAGFVVNLEGAYTQLADLKTEAESARDTLIDLQKNGLEKLKDVDVNFDLNAEGDDLVSEQEKAIKLLDKFKKDGKIDLKMEGAQQALDIAEYLTIKLDDLTEPKYMQLDASKVEEDIREPLEDMQEFEKLAKEKHLLQLTGDTKKIKEVQDDMDEIAQGLEDLDKETKIKLGIDGLTSEEIASKLEKGEIDIPAELKLDVQMSDDLKDMRLMMMNQLGLASDNEVKLKIGYDIDDSVVDSLTDEEKEVVVKYLAEHDEVDDYTPEQKEALVKYIADGGNLDDYTPDEKQAIVQYFADGGNVDSYTPEEKQAIVEYLTDSGDPDSWTPEQKEAVAKFKKDSAEVDNYTPEDKQAIAKFIKNSSEPDNYQPPDKTQEVTANLDSSEPDNYQPEDKKFTVKAVLQKIGDWTNKLLSGGSKRSVVNGTANVDGTAFVDGTTGRAFAQGNWRTKKTENALTGELGREIVVTPNNEWYTVGDNGAEFVNIPRGSIVFNHKQTEELLSNGKAISGGGRAKALASGTAFSVGSGGIGKVITPVTKDGGSKKKTTTTTTTKSTKEATTTTTTTTTGSSGSGGTGKANGKSIGSKSSSSSSSSNEKEFEESFDWIEIAISRIERAIDKLGQKANNIYKSWSSRNKALTEEIEKVREEIELQDDAANRYLQEANSVGLSSSWAEKVRNGEINLDTVKDEDLAEKIGQYEEWYNKYLACIDAAEELRETEAELYAQRIENVSAQYDGILGVIEHEKNMLDEYISQTEAQGHLVSGEYYEALASNEKDNLAQLKKEKDAMLKELEVAMASGTITEGSEAWYEMCASINEVTLAIAESETQLLEYQQTLQQLSWDVFDLLQDKLSAVSEETDFLIELLSSDKLFDDNGQLTNEGSATMGLHGQNYNSYMYQADLVAKEAEKLKKQLEEDPYDIELEERYREMIALQQEYILAAEQEKEAIRDLVSEGIELELDALQERIDKYNESMDAARDLYDYQKRVKEQSEEIADLEKQRSAYLGDESEEGKAKLQQIEVSLKEAKEELQETEYDKLIEDSSILLDELYLEYENLLNMRLDNLDALVARMIEQINMDSVAIGDTIRETADSVGYTLSDSMDTIWSSSTTNINGVITMYGEQFLTSQTTTNNALNTINTNLQNVIAQLNSIAETNVESAENSSATESEEAQTPEAPKEDKKDEPSTPTENEIKVGGKINAGSAKIYDYVGDKSGERQYYRNDPIYTVLSEKNGYLKVRHHKLSSGVTGWFKKSDVKAYATGAKRINADDVAWTQEGKKKEFIVRPSDGAILTPVAKGDSVLNATASGNIWNMANNPSEFIKDNLKLDTSNVPNNSNVNHSVVQHFDNITFSMPNVRNYNEMLTQMQKDPKFDKLIQAMTLDKIAGKSSLTKGKSIR